MDPMVKPWDDRGEGKAKVKTEEGIGAPVSAHSVIAGLDPAIHAVSFRHM